jgi:hypothetical protein
MTRQLYGMHGTDHGRQSGREKTMKESMDYLGY